MQKSPKAIYSETRSYEKCTALCIKANDGNYANTARRKKFMIEFGLILEVFIEATRRSAENIKKIIKY